MYANKNSSFALRNSTSTVRVMCTRMGGVYVSRYIGTDSYGRSSPVLEYDYYSVCQVRSGGNVDYYDDWSVADSCGRSSPGISDNIRFSYAFFINSTGEVDYESPNIIYSYGKFQSKLITVKEFIIPSILEALNYDFYVGHVYGLS